MRSSAAPSRPPPGSSRAPPPPPPPVASPSAAIARIRRASSDAGGSAHARSSSSRSNPFFRSAPRTASPSSSAASAAPDAFESRASDPRISAARASNAAETDGGVRADRAGRGRAAARTTPPVDPRSDDRSPDDRAPPSSEENRDPADAGDGDLLAAVAAVAAVATLVALEDRARRDANAAAAAGGVRNRSPRVVVVVSGEAGVPLAAAEDALARRRRNDDAPGVAEPGTFRAVAGGETFAGAGVRLLRRASSAARAVPPPPHGGRGFFDPLLSVGVAATEGGVSAPRRPTRARGDDDDGETRASALSARLAAATGTRLGDPRVVLERRLGVQPSSDADAGSADAGSAAAEGVYASAAAAAAAAWALSRRVGALPDGPGVPSETLLRALGTAAAYTSEPASSRDDE